MASSDARIAQLVQKIEDMNDRTSGFMLKQDGINNKLFDLGNQNSSLLVKFEERLCNHLTDHNKAISEHLTDHKMNDLKASFTGAIGGGSITAILGAIVLILKDRFGL